MKAVKVGNIGTDHDGFHPTKVTAGSPDVFIDGVPAARVGDPLEPHDKPNNPKHGRTIGNGTINIGDEHNPTSIPKLKPIFSRKFIIHDRDGKPIPKLCEQHQNAQ